MPTHLYRGGLTKLGRAMAISGAAFSSTLGQRTFLAQAFVMTMFNLRLGYWIDNPKKYCPRTIGAPSRTIVDKIKAFGRLRRHTPLTQESTAFWPIYLWQELSGAADSQDPLVNLSDGGHTDNLAFYPLLQRRCRLVVVTDVGMDWKFAFSDISNLIRRIYIEENIKIDIDLEPLCPDANGCSSQHFVVGEITYPPDPPEENEPTTGWFIYIKSAITGDEKGSVKAYWRTHRQNHFPHQTTLDQFYDDSQFESYRRLGQHSVESVIDTLRDYYQRIDENYEKVLTDGYIFDQAVLRNFRKTEESQKKLSYSELLELYRGFGVFKQRIYGKQDVDRSDWPDLGGPEKRKIQFFAVSIEASHPEKDDLQKYLDQEFKDKCAEAVRKPLEKISKNPNRELSFSILDVVRKILKDPDVLDALNFEEIVIVRYMVENISHWLQGVMWKINICDIIKAQEEDQDNLEGELREKVKVLYRSIDRARDMLSILKENSPGQKLMTTVLPSEVSLNEVMGDLRKAASKK